MSNQVEINPKKRVKRNKNEVERQLQISQGTLFQVILDGKPRDRIDVITDVGQADYFFSAATYHDNDGNLCFGLGGTGGLKYVYKIVGQISLEELIAAARRGAKRQGYELSQRQEEYLRESATKGTRVLTL